MGDKTNEPKDSFVKEILDYLSNQKDESDLYDVVIEVGNREFKGHRLVLAATSGYFRGLFGSGMREDTEKKIRLEETTFSQQAVALVLDILYTGRITLTKENVTEIWSTANQLEILFLLKECENFVLSTISHENCVGIYQDGKLFDSAVVTETAWDYILEHFDEVVDSNDILILEFAEIKKLVLSEDLKTDSEDNVVDLILRWVAFGDEAEQNNTASRIKSPLRKTHLFELLASTRLCLVSSTCLLTTVMGNKYVQENKDTQPLIEESLKYNMMLDRRHDFSSPRAIYRATGPFSNVIVRGNILGLYFNQTRGLKRFHMAKLNNPNGDSFKICGYGNNTFYAILSSSQSELRIQELNLMTTKWQELPMIQSVSKLHSLLALGSYLFAITQGKDARFCVYRYDTSRSAKEWKCFTSEASLGTVVASTTMDNAIILLEKVNDSVVVKHLDPSTMNITCVSGVKFDTNVSFVTFRKNSDAFVLQNNGILWHLRSLQGHPHVTFKQETMLWGFERVVYGAILVNDELLLYGPSINQSEKTDDVVWQISVSGVFDRVRNVSTNDAGQYQQTVINRDLLTRGPLERMNMS